MVIGVTVRQAQPARTAKSTFSTNARAIRVSKSMPFARTCTVITSVTVPPSGVARIARYTTRITSAACTADPTSTCLRSQATTNQIWNANEESVARTTARRRRVISYVMRSVIITRATLTAMIAHWALIIRGTTAPRESVAGMCLEMEFAMKPATTRNVSSTAETARRNYLLASEYLFNFVILRKLNILTIFSIEFLLITLLCFAVRSITRTAKNITPTAIVITAATMRSATGMVSTARENRHR